MEKLTDQVVKDFIKFLKEKDAYQNYRDAIKEQRGVTVEEFFLKAFSNELEDVYYPIDLLDGVMVWYITDQGQDYWDNLNDQWVKFLNNE